MELGKLSSWNSSTKILGPYTFCLLSGVSWRRSVSESRSVIMSAIPLSTLTPVAGEPVSEEMTTGDKGLPPPLIETTGMTDGTSDLILTGEGAVGEGGVGEGAGFWLKSKPPGGIGWGRWGPMTGRTWIDGDTTGLMCLPESTVAVVAGSTEADILGGCWRPAASGLRLITMVVVFPPGTDELQPVEAAIDEEEEDITWFWK